MNSLARILAPAPPRLAWQIASVLGFAALTAIGASIAIPLPFTPVPVTLQTLFVLLAGLTLGPRRGAASMALYVLLGSLGAHCFAGGHWGLQTIGGPTGGYLLGFVLAQPLLGWLAERGRGRSAHLVVAAVVGDFLILLCGATWLAVWLGLSAKAAFLLGVWPFLAGDGLKIALAVGIVRTCGAARRG